MKIYTDVNAATRFYYQCQLKNRVKMVCLDLHQSSANDTIAKTIIKKYFGDEFVSAELDLKQEIETEEEEVQNG